MKLLELGSELLKLFRAIFTDLLHLKPIQSISAAIAVHLDLEERVFAESFLDSNYRIHQMKLLIVLDGQSLFF